MLNSVLEWAFYHVSDSKLYISDLSIEPRTAVTSSSPDSSHIDLLTGAANVIQALPQNFVALSKEFRRQWRPRHPRQQSLYLNSKEELQKLPFGRVTLSSPQEVATIPESCQPVKGSSHWSQSLEEGFRSSFALWSDDSISVSPLGEY